jgi:hypothetical protein
LLCVADANLWIDLADGGLLAEAFQIGVRWVTLDLTARELVSCGADLMALGLEQSGLPGSQIAEIIPARNKYPRPSFNDIAALVLARHLHGTLITGDGDLRKAAEAEGVALHGVLWVLDEMVSRRVVTPARAADALSAMLGSGSRLPKDECDKRLAIWR